MVKLNNKSEDVTDDEDQINNFLKLSGRWVECTVPVDDGKSQICVASLYGIAGASNDHSKKDATERLLAHAIIRLAQLKDVPYYLNMDLNVDPAKMDILGKAIDTQVIFERAKDKFNGEGFSVHSEA